MKKIISSALAMLLCAVLLTACQAEPNLTESTTETTTEATTAETTAEATTTEATATEATTELTTVATTSRTVETPPPRPEPEADGTSMPYYLNDGSLFPQAFEIMYDPTYYPVASTESEYRDWNSYHGLYTRRSVSFVNENTGFVLFSSVTDKADRTATNDIWRTDDGGKSWELVYSLAYSDPDAGYSLAGELTNIWFVDDMHGLCLCAREENTENADFVLTSDGGKTWSSVWENEDWMRYFLPDELCDIVVSEGRAGLNTPFVRLVKLDLMTGFSDRADVVVYYSTEMNGGVSEKITVFGEDHLAEIF